MALFARGNAPGFDTNIETEEVDVNWTGRDGQTQIADNKVTIDKANTDAGNTPTTTIRGGMIMSRETTSGNEYIYDPDANDGRQFITGVLDHMQDMLKDSTATDRFEKIQVLGLMKTSRLIEDGGTVGDVSLHAQSALTALGVKLDKSRNLGAKFLSHPMGSEIIAATTKTLVAADNGKLFIQTTGAGNYTLPANSDANLGFTVQILQTTDNALVITSAAGDDIVALNNAAADTVTFSTGSQQIGSKVQVSLVQTASGTRRWTIDNLGGTTAVAAG